MKDEAASPLGFEIDLDRLQSLFDEDLSQIRRDISGQGDGEREDSRSSALAWAARFVPEGLSPRFRADLESLVGELRARSRFRVDFWDRCLPLDVALYCLTHNRKWLEVALCNVDHHNSRLRPWVLECLALVADLMDFEDPELQARTEHNIEINQMFSDWNVVLVAAARGAIERKTEVFTTWQTKYAGSPVFSVGALLDDLCRGFSVDNPFLAHFLRIHQYVLLRLAAIAEKPTQLRLPIADDPLSERSERPRHSTVQRQFSLAFVNPERPTLTVEMVWRRLKDHPLMESHFALTTNKEHA